MKKNKKFMWIGIIVFTAALGAAMWGPIASNVEQAKYVVVESVGDIEIRDYSKMIVAEVEVSGDRKEAANQGFRLIADYIFGNNKSTQKVAMTAPVLQEPNEKIAMTAPVIQEGGENIWKIKFVMPSAYNIESLPKPNNDAVKIYEIPQKRFAVIKFSGFSTKENLLTHKNKLQDFVNSQKLKVVAKPVYAFFNPPWTLPFLRRNEVMIEIAK